LIIAEHNGTVLHLAGKYKALISIKTTKNNIMPLMLPETLWQKSGSARTLSLIT